MPRRRDVFLLPATPRQPRRPAELANMRGHICALQVRAPRNHGRAAQTAARLSHASHPPPPPHRSQRPPPPCSIANCTTEFPGKRESDIGEGIAACGCMTPGCVRCPLGGACGARLARVAEGGGRRACNCTRAPHPLWEVALSRILLHPTPPHPTHPGTQPPLAHPPLLPPPTPAPSPAPSVPLVLTTTYPTTRGSPPSTSWTASCKVRRLRPAATALAPSW